MLLDCSVIYVNKVKKWLIILIKVFIFELSIKIKNNSKGDNVMQQYFDTINLKQVRIKVHHNTKCFCSTLPKQKTYLTEAEEAQKIKDAQRTKLLNMYKESNRVKPFVLELNQAIAAKNNPLLVELITKYGMEFGFFNKKIESLIAQKPILISKIVINHYLKTLDDTSQTIRSSKFIPLKLKYTISKKDKERHNRVEEEIKKLNPNYEMNLYIIED